MYRALAAALLLATLLSPGGAAAPESRPSFAAVVPNPAAGNDRGERLVLSFPRGTDLSRWSIADDDGTVRLPDRTVAGRVVVTPDPAAVRNRTDLPVVAPRGRLGLANGGERLRLRRPNATVAAVSYGDAPEGEAYVRSEEGWRWRPVGATDRPVVVARDVRARLFVLPDAPDEPVAALAAARERVLLAGYTFTSRRVARALCAARDRGVRVRVLLDADPVGGLVRREARRLDALAACGVRVTVLGARRARYRFHHAKYAVIDDRALVLTENWKPAGTGGRSSRGWGAVVESAAVADALAATFRADAGWHGAVSWEAFRDGKRFRRGEPPANGSFPARFAPRTIGAARVEVLVAPDNAERRVVAALDRADRSIRVQQAAIGSPNHPFVRALFRAARRGVRVRVLLSGAWYARESNAALAARLNERAADEGLPLEVRIAEPRSRYAKVHAKGVVIDGETAVLGSLNWNNVSVRENREVALLIEGTGGYYARVFRADWRGGAWRLPVGFGAAALLACLGAVAVGRRVEF